MDEAVQQRPMRHYCIVRNDLSPGQKAAQLVHAAGESGLGAATPGNTIAVALEGSTEEISALLPELERRDYRFKPIVETDGDFAGQLVAVGLEPSNENRLRKLVHHFKQVQ
jgi:hypothetical protein